VHAREAAPRRLHWARPELVAEVAFTEWTSAGQLRHPRYLGLRDDKAADDVVREAR
jgi:bifunctional non-homologous end joining protein LigD